MTFRNKAIRLIGCLLACVAALVALGAASPSGAAPPAAQVQGQAEEAVRVRRATQQAVDQFSRQEAKLLEEAATLKREIAAVTRRLAKARAYLADQEAKVAEHQARLAEIARMRAELEPYLDQTVARLDEVLQTARGLEDRGRQARIQALKDKLNDYQAGLAAKARLVLAALAAEARFGLGVAVKPAEVEIEGRLRRVRLLHLGRLALFALSADGRSAWRFDRAAGRFVAMSEGQREVRMAVEIAERRRVVGLVKLPVGAAPAQGSRP